MTVFTNHLGYSSRGVKKALLQAGAGSHPGAFRVLEAASGREVFSGEARPRGSVQGWGRAAYWELEFSGLRGEGSYLVVVDAEGGAVRSQSFEIRETLLSIRMISAVGYYFKAQRDSGEWLARDGRIGFNGQREGTVDARGGWFDATGDYSIHLSHLSHASYFNPQQAAFSAYAFFKVLGLLEESGDEQYSMVSRRMLDEGTWGADFLMRMRSPSGSFFRSIQRGQAFGLVSEKRKIDYELHGSSAQFGPAATAAEETVTDYNYEVSMRSGGGLAVAALAAAGGRFYPGTAFSQEEYIAAAKAAYALLERENARYTNDGEWNLIDEYCALLALVELYRTTAEYGYLLKAREMAARVEGRLVDEPPFEGKGAASWEVAPNRPFYHASDAGMPAYALLAYAGAEPSSARAQEAIAACERAMRFELALTREVENPFGYARFMHADEDSGERRTGFFFPHNSRAKPWWQGENARLASLACAATLLASRTSDRALGAALRRYAADQIDWIMGLNPFDSCMIEGYGRNNIQYSFDGRYDFINCPGGICNGITSGIEDEDGIEFLRFAKGEVTDNWRWAEQWLPHASWFLLAQSARVASEAGKE
jgi:hypothetical protein